MLEELEVYVPDYIKQEIDEYIIDIKKGKGRSAKLSNIRTLLRVAMLNNRITFDKVILIENWLIDLGNI